MPATSENTSQGGGPPGPLAGNLSNDLPSPGAVLGPMLDGGNGLLPSGGWYCEVDFTNGGVFAGVVRVTSNGDGTSILTGDFYAKPANVVLAPGVLPVFPLRDWKFFARCVQFKRNPDRSLIIEWEFWVLSSGGWQLQGKWLTSLSFEAASNEGGEVCSGPVYAANFPPAGTWRMRRHTPFLRQALIEIDAIAGSPPPLSSKQTPLWSQAFAEGGLQVEARHDNLQLPSFGRLVWSPAELHELMIKARQKVNQDAVWYAHLLVVPNIAGTPRGLMFDALGADTNNLPREGAAVATHWMVPDSPIWGDARNRPFGASVPLFLRSAMHEIAHVFNLEHDVTGGGLMCTTDVLAGAATAAKPVTVLAANGFHFAQKARTSLAHWSDVAVRPGGLPFVDTSGTEDARNASVSRSLKLHMQLPVPIIPLGAPLRVNFEVENTSKKKMKVPKNMGFKGGCLQGRVVAPAGTTRVFRPVFWCMDGEELVDLAPGGRHCGAITLWRGGQGPLFPAPGYHRIEIDIVWADGARTQKVSGSSGCLVQGATTRSHAAAALAVLQSADLQLLLALGGDHHIEANRAIKIALRSPVLRPHWIYVEANRWARPHLKRRTDLRKVRGLLRSPSKAVLNWREKEKADQWDKKNPASGKTVKLRKKQAPKPQGRKSARQEEEVLTPPENTRNFTH